MKLPFNLCLLPNIHKTASRILKSFSPLYRASNGVSSELPTQYKVSQREKEFYDKNGYLVLSGLIDFETLYTCKRHFVNICNGRANSGNMIVMKEISLMKSGAKGEDLINKVQDILFDDTFSMYSENPRLLDVLQQFIGENITAVHSMLINKPPGTSEHPPHQDLYYFPFRPANKIIATWTAIDEVTVDNGCLWVVSGSHKPDQLYEHDYPPSKNGVINKAYHGVVDADTIAPQNLRINLEMQPGDTVFFHPLLIHGSGPNVTKKYRKAISCHYASSECHYIDTKGTIQAKIEQEIIAMAKKKVGIELDSMIPIWQARSKTVRGVKCNL